MEDKRSSKKLILVLFGAAFLLFLGMRGTAANAASLYLSPTAGEYKLGQNFSLTAGVSSPDQAINAVSGVISFPADKLEVVSVSKNGSVLGLWVQDPSFSNANGTVNFEGIALNPGFTGSAGKVISIAFKAKDAGAAAVSFSSGSVLANDGLGTNITASLGRASIMIKENSAPTASEPTLAPTTQPTNVNIKTGLPTAVVITSTTHPDGNAWYAKDTADLRWTLPAKATAVSVFVDQKASTVPAPASDGLFDDYSTKRLADGIWYFHLRVKNAAGWGLASHYRLQIDTSVPDNFFIKFIDGNETNNPQPTIVFNTTDAGSGVDHYEIKVGEDNSIIVSAVEVKSNPYVLPVQQPGARRLLIVAVDKAGNHVSSSADFTVMALSKPVITQYPHRLKAGDVLTIKGTTDYPDTPVRVWIQTEDGPPAGVTIRTDSKGAFVYMVDGKMRTGIFKLWAQMRDENGGTSLLSDKVTVVVEAQSLIIIDNHEISVWYIIILPLLIGCAAWIAVRRSRRYLSGCQDKFNKNLVNIKEDMHHAFDDLREKMMDKLKAIEQSRRSKEFTVTEKKMLNDFKKDLINTEAVLLKRLDSIKMPKKR